MQHRKGQSVQRRGQLFGHPDLKLKKLDPTAKVPEYKTPGSAGMDVAACLRYPVTIAPGHIELISTGWAAAIPEGYELQVRPRSGMAIKKGLTVVNAPGTIDEDYRGEIKIGVINHGLHPVTVENGNRIAQLVLSPVVQPNVVVVQDLDDTERGDGGFGSTGE